MDSQFTIEEIRRVLPHRYPFLLIDRVTEIDESAGTIKGYKNITANEPVFTGHFPERSIFPGVLIIEAMAQLGAVYMLKKVPEENRMAYFAGIDRARFKRVVIPGDRLDFELRLLRERGSFAVVEGKAFVEGQLAAEAVLMSSLGK
jgi:3-hydroxyacyl-[acyl-carrier-protein] dehydratase